MHLENPHNGECDRHHSLSSQSGDDRIPATPAGLSGRRLRFCVGMSFASIPPR